MKQHTTNYTNTFIEVAEDSPAVNGEVPPSKAGSPGAPTVAGLQFEILSRNPYKFTSDEVLFAVFAERNDIPESELEKARQEFFSKGQPCFRSSPLTKRYGWGIHSDSQGRIAMYGRGSTEYEQLLADKKLATVKAMRSKRG